MNYKRLAESLKNCGDCSIACTGCEYAKYSPFCDCYKKITEDASTAITELLEKAERAENNLAKSSWISVKDMLPDDSDSGKEFFCMTNAKGRSNGVIALKFEHTFVKGKEVRRWRWMGKICPWEVTHWMPRPEPYKEDNDG